MAVRRVAKKTKPKKVVKKKTTARKQTQAGSKSDTYNRNALWKAYKDLQKKADLAWEKFRGDLKRKAKSEIIIQDHKQLLLLLGECDYMARECMRQAAANKKRK